MHWLNDLLPNMDTADGCLQYFDSFSENGDKTSTVSFFILVPQKKGWLEVKVTEHPATVSANECDEFTSGIFGGGKIAMMLRGKIEDSFYKRNDDAESEPVTFSALSHSANVLAVVLEDSTGFLYLADKDGKFKRQQKAA